MLYLLLLVCTTSYPFEADARRDIDAIVALFTSEAVVVDEGQTYHGTAEIRSGQEGATSSQQTGITRMTH